MQHLGNVLRNIFSSSIPGIFTHNIEEVELDSTTASVVVSLVFAFNIAGSSFSGDTM